MTEEKTMRHRANQANNNELFPQQTAPVRRPPLARQSELPLACAVLAGDDEVAAAICPGGGSVVRLLPERTETIPFAGDDAD